MNQTTDTTKHLKFLSESTVINGLFNQIDKFDLTQLYHLKFIIEMRIKTIEGDRLNSLNKKMEKLSK